MNPLIYGTKNLFCDICQKQISDLKNGYVYRKLGMALCLCYNCVRFFDTMYRRILNGPQ